ncbi:DUF7768 domain-containing protein [Sporanaerobacter acetigenes]|uniref:DUF7768 domain-containing protein n=1 Tax=Sporanaerobacter acetigenes DSM 13106 TaxID=1123281 RepID=A0A1M5U9B4_9FIRM|nr:hypothetical protein [Sporanaerobacter acetigenes]SHH59645.1 hypothetical protein SAMN02745180_00569 [Sporanaerobacter acetigenes DSM 13106]
MKLIYVSFPLSDNSKYNKENVDKYCKYALEQRCLPVTPIAIIEQLERVSDGKDQIFNKRLELIKRCDELWFFEKEYTSNMINEIQVAKSLNIAVRYIDFEGKSDKSNVLENYQSKYEKAKRVYNYQKYLKGVNDLLYSGDLYKIDYSFKSYLEGRIEDDDILSETQKKYLSNKLHSYPFTFDYLDKGYRYIWNLNNDIRNDTLYVRTMYFIKFLEWGDKKVSLMKKMFNFIRNDKAISEHRKRKIVEDLYYEIVKQSELEKHPKNFMLKEIYKYEDIHDLLEAFLED